MLTTWTREPTVPIASASKKDRMAAWLRALLAPSGPARRAGQSLVEYALIIVLIAIAVILALGALSGQIQNVFNRITGSLGG
jgi:pilus assembly protein Flp/PilA